MSKTQYLLIGGTLSLVAILFFGFNTVSKFKEESSAKSSEEIISETEAILSKEEIENFQKRLEVDEINYIDSLEAVGGADAMKTLSSFWAQKREWVMAAAYAEDVAEIVNDSMSWAIAANTLSLAAKSADVEGQKEKIIANAMVAYDKAQSFAPEWIEPKINAALLLVDNPPSENPMMGIQSLLGLQKEYPESASVLFHLGRLGISTGQYEKALDRLLKAESLAPNDQRIVCLLAQLYGQMGDGLKAQEYQEKCDFK